MTTILAIVILLSSPALAIRAPSADEVESLKSNTDGAYREGNLLADLEKSLQQAVRTDSADWESLLSLEQARQLSAARLRASSAWTTLFEETIIAYGLLPLEPSPAGGPDIPRYPNELMQGGPFKDTRRPWRIVFTEPEEGSVLGRDGKPLLGPAFDKFLETHSGKTSPDGTTIIWGRTFKGRPFKLAQVIYHELSHYEMFADPTWVDSKTGPEREIDAHMRSKAALAGFGLDPQTLKDEQNLEDGNIAFYFAEKSTEKSATERRTRLDELLEFLGFKPRPEDPGYKVYDEYFMNPEVWARIRESGERLKFRTDAQRSERAVLRIAEDICADPRSASSPAMQQRFAAIPAYDAAATLAVPDPCESAVHGLLWNAKARGQHAYFPPAVASMAESNRPRIVQPSATIVDFRLSEMAKRICAFPPAAFDPANAKEFRDLPRLNFSEPRPRDPHSCHAKVHRRLWLWLTSGRSELDSGELSRITDEPSHVAAPATLPQAPRPSPPPPAPPPPVPPEDLEPRPRETPGEAFPPCLHDRCTRRL